MTDETDATRTRDFFVPSLSMINSALIPGDRTVRRVGVARDG